MERGFEIVSAKIGRAILPLRATKNSAGYDFYTPEAITIRPGEVVKIMTGVKAKMQDGEFLMLDIRSSFGIKKGLVHCESIWNFMLFEKEPFVPILPIFFPIKRSVPFLIETILFVHSFNHSTNIN